MQEDPTELYLVKMSDPSTGEEFYKIGVSQSAKGRFAYGTTKVADADLTLREKVDLMMKGQQYIPDHPYQVEHLHRVKFTYEGEAYLQEDALLDALKSAQYWPKLPFSGHSECFNCNDEIREMLIEAMDDLASKAREREPDLLKYKFAAIGVKETDPIERHRLILERIKERFGED